MAPQGGYREPRNPAMVSGPGRLSQRTDGQPRAQLPNAEYGEQKEFQNLQSGAPLARSGQAMPAITPLDAPTERPDEPVTAGAPSGPGPGPEALGLSTKTISDDYKMLRTYMPLMQMYADSDASTGTMRAFVRYLKGVSAG